MSEIAIQLQQDTLILSGDWTLDTIKKLNYFPIKNITWPTYPLQIDGTKIQIMDTAGAVYLYELLEQLKNFNLKIENKKFQADHQQLLDYVTPKIAATEAIPTTKKHGIFYTIGRNAAILSQQITDWLTFIGETFTVFLRLIMRPHLFKWNYLINIIEKTGYRALPIIAFLSLLIGIVLTYQIGLELRLYGANIYIVNLLGIAILREFGPLITAIIVIGRTGSAYTAQLGIMKVNEEIDALQTMGLSPTELLIIPRIIGLMIVMPLLTVWSDIFAIIGGMFMSNAILSISYYNFLQQFPEVVTFTTFAIGLIKAPVFAIVIALVGCFQGFRVSGSAESVGWQTTKSVVLAIFMIIIVDAAFSIILSWLGI